MTRILVGRYHDLAEFMQAWPALAMLKASLPKAFVVALVPSHAAPLAGLCPYLDDVIVDVGAGGSAHDKDRLVHIIHAHRLDVSIHVHPNYHNAKLSRHARIPYRLGPASTWLRFMYTHRFRLELKGGEEEGHHTAVVRHFLTSLGLEPKLPPPPYLRFAAAEVAEQRRVLAKQLSLNERRQWCFVHLGTALSLAQYAQLLNLWLRDHIDVDVVICAQPEAWEAVLALQGLLQDPTRAVAYLDHDSLVDFARSLACASVFVAGAGGPLQLAAALDVATVGFYTAAALADPRHGRPINAAGRHLAFCAKGGDPDLHQLDMAASYGEIKTWLAQSQSQSTDLRI
ncbi:MAG: glycosyltransferase family 9 protein [Neisseriaceae bacterium]|nr:glycosyltransferase family 9 protein [Neisseriaceae bacterium]